MESLPTDALICADANAHHPAWDATGKVTDGRGRALHRWIGEKHMHILSTGEATRLGSTGASAP
eukprot:gene19795-biopygen4133